MLPAGWSLLAGFLLFHFRQRAGSKSHQTTFPAAAVCLRDYESRLQRWLSTKQMHQDEVWNKFDASMIVASIEKEIRHGRKPS
jgi:hypothetical protein